MTIGSPGIFPKNDNNIVYAEDYNHIQNIVENLLGTGLSDQGYGQVVSSSEVNVDDSIIVSEWLNLRNDLLKIRQHQTGIDESGNLILATSGAVITNEFVNQYKTFSTTCTTNRLTIATNQGQQDDFITRSRSTAWNGVLTHTVTVTFASANAARHWFNAGGQFRFTASRVGGSSGSKNTIWTNLLSSMGTITFNHGSTTYSGSGATTVATGTGWYNLTTSDQTIFVKPADSGVYVENDYNIQARRNSTSTVLTFTIQFRDDDTGDPPILPLPKGAIPGGVDENVDGTLTSTIRLFRPVGANVELPAPAGSDTAF